MAEVIAESVTDVPNLGQVAEVLINGTDFVTRLLIVACFVIGIGLVIVGILMYQSHRRNPKFVPLDRVIMYVILGLLVLGIPFLGQIIAPTSSTIDIKKQQSSKHHVQDIDAPLELGNEFEH